MSFQYSKSPWYISFKMSYYRRQTGGPKISGEKSKMSTMGGWDQLLQNCFLFVDICLFNSKCNDLWTENEDDRRAGN